jgi:hypothetical protein
MSGQEKLLAAVLKYLFVIAAQIFDIFRSVFSLNFMKTCPLLATLLVKWYFRREPLYFSEKEKEAHTHARPRGAPGTGYQALT